jgi:hypothetical protein
MGNLVLIILVIILVVMASSVVIIYINMDKNKICSDNKVKVCTRGWGFVGIIPFITPEECFCQFKP